MLPQHRWKNLLAWLQGHGFHTQDLPVNCRETSFAGNGLFACRACVPGSLLFIVPPKVLMNKMTLKHHYPPDVRVLTAVQLISMHLFIWRPLKADEDSADPSFGPYISTLPRDFVSHPLTWLVLSNHDKADDLQTALLDSLPPSVLAALHLLHARFWDDWCAVRTFLQRTPPVMVVAQGPLNDFDAVIGFLWGWLNVNTRCIYYRLKHAKADPDNMTMCPLVDFANHTTCQARMILVPSHSEIWDAAPVNSIGDGLKFIVPNTIKIEEGDEILLTYGPHSNKTLFVEYGFVNILSDNRPSQNGEADVQDLVEKHVFTDTRLREAVKAVLVAEGYWSEWTLHSTSDSAQPSWRLITALRLYHLVVGIGHANNDAIQPWRDVTAGKRPWVSCENEQCWKGTVVFVCDMVIERAERAERAIATAQGPSPDKKGGVGWAQWMSGNIQSLWKEELFVARGVKNSVLRGDEF